MNRLTGTNVLTEPGLSVTRAKGSVPHATYATVSPGTRLTVSSRRGRVRVRVRRPGRRRSGFSLMEMMLATAILAGSGTALFLLIGQGSDFGRRAEERATALHLAQSLLDEALTMPENVEGQGTFESDPRWGYRVTRDAVDIPSASGLSSSATSASAPSASAPSASTSAGVGLVRVTVEVFIEEAAGVGGGEPEDVACRLVQIVRRPGFDPGGPDSGDPSVETGPPGDPDWPPMPPAGGLLPGTGGLDGGPSSPAFPGTLPGLTP